MGFWGSEQVIVKVAIILGILTFVILVLGCVKLGLKNRRCAKHSRHHELEDRPRKNANQLGRRKPHRWADSGVCAIEKESYGVCQSRPTTAADSVRTSFDDSRSTTTRASINYRHGVSTSLSGTTLNSLEALSLPPKSSPSSKKPKRLTLGFDTLSITSLDNIELQFLAGRETASARYFRPMSQLTPGSQGDSVGDHISTEHRPKSDTFMLTSPISSSLLSSVSQDWTLSPAPAHIPTGSAEYEYKLPTVPRPTALRNSRSALDALDEDAERPPTRRQGNEALLTTFDFSSFELWTKSYPPTREPDVQVAPEHHSYPTRDSIASEYSDEDSPNELSGVSRGFLSFPKHKRSDSASHFMTHLQLPTHSSNISLGSIDRIYDSVKIKHAKNFSKDLATGKTEIGNEVEQNKTQTYLTPDDSDLQHTTLNPLSPANDSNNTLKDTRELKESPSSNEQTLQDPSFVSSSISASDAAEANAVDDRSGLSNASSTQNVPMPTISISRHRSNSEGSMCSISEMYGLYIKRPTIAAPLADYDEAGLFDLDSRTKLEQLEYEQTEESKKNFLSASMAVPGVRRKKSPPASLILDEPNTGIFVPRAIESPVSKWKI